MVILSLEILMLSLILQRFKSLVELCLSSLQVVLLDLELRLTSSTNSSFSLAFTGDNFNFKYLLSHEIAPKHVFNHTKAWGVTSCEEGFCIPHPGKFYLDLGHLCFCPCCKNLQDHSESVNHSNFPICFEATSIV